MPSTGYIYNITGSTPFQVYISFSGDSTQYYYIDQITSAQLPYEFNLPKAIQDMNAYCVKIVDSDGCIITGCTTT